MRVCVRPGCDREIPEAASETRVYCEPRCRTAHWREKREKPKRVKPSGRQVSYVKAVDVVGEALAGYDWVSHGWPGEPDEDQMRGYRMVAEGWLREALPERQRVAR